MGFLRYWAFVIAFIVGLVSSVWFNLSATYGTVLGCVIYLIIDIVGEKMDKKEEGREEQLL